MRPPKVRFAADSSLEGQGFEPSVPLKDDPISRVKEEGAGGVEPGSLDTPSADGGRRAETASRRSDRDRTPEHTVNGFAPSPLALLAKSSSPPIS